MNKVKIVIKKNNYIMIKHNLNLANKHNANPHKAIEVRKNTLENVKNSKVKDLYKVLILLLHLV